MGFEIAGVQLIAQGGDSYITTMHNATNVTNTFVDATEKGGGRVSGAGQVMIGALRELGTIATQAFLTAGKAAVSFVKDSISVAGDFEAGMHKFQAVAGDAVDTKGLEKFKDLFISLGKELPVSTSEVEQAAIEMVSGGIDPAIVQAGALRSTIQFAAASGLSLADAAATSAKFLAGWTSSAATTAEKVDFLTSSTDALTKAAAASSTTAAELRLGIFNVQGAAQALHAPFTDVVATLAELAPAFESSAQAGTALNVFMTRLEPQTDKARDSMKELGIITKGGQNIFFDAQGSFLGMGNAAQVLKEKLGGMTDQQKISTLHELFGNDAMKVGNLLMQDGAAGLDAMKAKMAAANGVSSTAALMQSGYNTALENAKGSVEALQITIGSLLLPVLTDLMNNVIAPAINTITDFASALFGSDDAFNRLSPTLQGVATLLANLGSYFAAVVDDGDYLNDFLAALPVPIQGVVGGVGMLVAAFGPLQSYIGAVVDDGDTLNDFLIHIPKPMQGVVQAIGTLIAAFGDTSGVLTDLNGIWNLYLKTVTDVGNGYLAIAQAVLPIVTKFWTDHGTQILTFLQTTYDKIISIVNLALQLYDAIVPKVLGSVATFISAHAAAIETILGGAWDVIDGVVSGALDLIQGILKTALDLMRGDWKAAWADVQQMSAAVVLDLEQVIEGFLNIIAGFFDTSLQGIADVWQHNWEMLVKIATQTDWIAVGENVVAGIKEGISNAWSSLTSWISDKVHSMVSAAMDAIGAHSPATEFMPVGSFAVQGIMAGFDGMWPSLMSLVSDLGKDLTDQAQRIAESVQSAMADAFGATASIDRQKVSNLDAVAKLSARSQGGVQQQLNAVEQEAMQMTDPEQAKAWFALRSKQMLELAKLNDQIQATTDAKERDRLLAQYQLINAANNADISQFQAKAQAGGGMQDIIGSINKLMQDTGLGIIQSPVLAQLAQLLDQLASPAASSAQMSSSGGTTSYSAQTTYNMPVYTNNTPSALQQSLAILQASQV